MAKRRVVGAASARSVGRRHVLIVAGLVVAFAGAARAAGPVPVRVRLLKAARQGPAAIDPRLVDLQQQLGKLAYLRWEALSEHMADMQPGKAASFDLPDGAVLELTVLEAAKDTVTFEVKVNAHRTRSKLTISRDQRIVHQVTDEKDGVAYFCSVRPWP